MFKVAFVTNFVPPYRRSFYEKLCKAAAGVQWLVLRGHAGELGRVATSEQLDIPQQVIANREQRVGPFTLRWQRGALAAVREYAPEALVLLGISGTLSNWALLLWAHLNKVPVIMWTCGWEPHAADSLAFRFKKRIAGLYFRSATRLLVYSSKGAQYVEAMGVPRARTVICYNGIEIDHLLANEKDSRARATELRRREADADAEIVLFVGAMLPDKRLDLLLNAFVAVRAARPHAQLWLVGDGPERAATERLADTLGRERIRFFGRVVDGVEAFFAAADVVVLPGIGGLALNEAMFWGRPCVVSVADGTEDDLVMDGETGCRFRAGDSASLGTAIRRCLDLSPAERQQWGSAARRLILERSNVDRMVATFVAAIAELRGK